MDEIPQRKWLRHEAPDWVDSGAVFFVTINARPRGTEALLGEAGKAVISTAQFYHEKRVWWLRLVMVMPDHLHLLVSFPEEVAMKEQIRKFKAYLRRTISIDWQAGFFDHRLRNEAAIEEKWHYVMMNPVRAGLVDSPEKWALHWRPR